MATVKKATKAKSKPTPSKAAAKKTAKASKQATPKAAKTHARFDYARKFKVADAARVRTGLTLEVVEWIAKRGAVTGADVIAHFASHGEGKAKRYVYWLATHGVIVPA